MKKNGLLWLSLGLAGLMVSIPFWVMLSTSLMSAEQLFQNPKTGFFWPSAWQNYAILASKLPLLRYFGNSLFVAALITLGQVVFAALAGYGFARFEFKAKNWLFAAFLGTMMIPPQVNIVPLFWVMKQLHWVDTYAGLIVPGLFGAFGVFLMRQWFMAFPKELEEAAALDGCNPWQTFWRIAFPLAKPALVTLGLLAFIGSWNNFLWPLVITQSDELRTLPLGIAQLKASYRDITEWHILMAASTVSVLPVIALFLAGQKQFLKGLMQGSIKG